GADRVLSTPAPALSIVIPVYNEAESLGPLFAELGPALAALDRPVEVVAVDDGSTDGSFERLVVLAHGDPRIRIVRLARNYGQTAALAAGIAHARHLQVRPLAHAARATRPPHRQVPLRLLDPPDPALRALRAHLRRGGARAHGLPGLRAHRPRRAPREPPARAARHPDGGGRR